MDYLVFLPFVLFLDLCFWKNKAALGSAIFSQRFRDRILQPRYRYSTREDRMQLPEIQVHLQSLVVLCKQGVEVRTFTQRPQLLWSQVWWSQRLLSSPLCLSHPWSFPCRLCPWSLPCQLQPGSLLCQLQPSSLPCRPHLSFLLGWLRSLPQSSLQSGNL